MLAHFQRTQRVNQVAAGKLHGDGLTGHLGAEGRLDRRSHHILAIHYIGKDARNGIGGQKCVEARHQIGPPFEFVENLQHGLSSARCMGSTVPPVDDSLKIACDGRSLRFACKPLHKQKAGGKIKNAAAPSAG